MHTANFPPLIQEEQKKAAELRDKLKNYLKKAKEEKDKKK